MVRHIEKNEHMFLMETLEIMRRQGNESLLNEKVVDISKAWEFVIKK